METFKRPLYTGFRGPSDTEAFLEYVSAYGLDEALRASIGMFAVGVYDRQEKRCKKVLRNVLYRHVPKKMMDRPKKGFGILVDQWIRNGKLTEWAEDLLNEGSIRRQGG